MNFSGELGKHIREKSVLNTLRIIILLVLLGFSLIIHQDLLLTGFIFEKCANGGDKLAF